MDKKDFFFELPENLIAQTPIEPRDSSRLMCINRTISEIKHKHFYDILDIFNKGDLLVLNNSKVIPARIFGVKENGTAHIQILLLEEKEKDIWEIMCKPGKKARSGVIISFGEGLLRAEIIKTVDGGNKLARMYYNGNFFDILDKIGQMPLPHYITQELKDKQRYQTVYAEPMGSAAAPTAGLHFTNEILAKLHDKGVNTAFVTLHVGLGTFRPVKTEKIEEHKMHSEHYCLPKETADLINQTKQNGNRVIGVGTTSCRTLESVYQKEGAIVPCEGYTDIFIYPGYDFKVLDGIITNFHLPESTLIMLISAFAGHEKTMRAYKNAVENGYRFYSFGDAMLIL